MTRIDNGPVGDSMDEATTGSGDAVEVILETRDEYARLADELVEQQRETQEMRDAVFDAIEVIREQRERAEAAEAALADLRAAGLGLHIEPDSSGEPVLWKRNDNDTRWRGLCGRNDTGHEAWALIVAALAAAPSGERRQEDGQR